MTKRTFTTVFKIEAAGLGLDQGYSIAEASRVVAVSTSALGRWAKQLRAEHSGLSPIEGKALTSEQQKNQALEAKIKRIEREKEILEEATALLVSDSTNSSL